MHTRRRKKSTGGFKTSVLSALALPVSNVMQVCFCLWHRRSPFFFWCSWLPIRVIGNTAISRCDSSWMFESTWPTGWVLSQPSGLEALALSADVAELLSYLRCSPRSDATASQKGQTGTRVTTTGMQTTKHTKRAERAKAMRGLEHAWFLPGAHCAVTETRSPGVQILQKRSRA